MNGAQYEGIMGALEKILDRMPVRDLPDEPVTIRRMDGSTTEVGTPARARAAEVAADKRQALAIVRAVLDDWIRGAKENHEAMDHSRENRGSECWRTFAPSDFRNMINDAARELGLQEFPLPEVPEEDKPCE